MTGTDNLETVTGIFFHPCRYPFCVNPPKGPVSVYNNITGEFYILQWIFVNYEKRLTFPNPFEGLRKGFIGRRGRVSLFSFGGRQAVGRRYGPQASTRFHAE